LVVTDSPLLHGSSYEERIKYLQHHIAKNDPIAKVVSPHRIISKEHLREALAEVVHQGGEGLMIRKASSKYHEPNSLLHAKESIEREVLVTSLSPLRCIDTKGTTFHCLNSIKNQHFKAGTSIATIQIASIHKNFDGSMMAFMKEIRNDITWSDLYTKMYPYFIGFGKSSIARCRTCDYQFRKDELRVKTTILRKMHGSFMPSPINQCVKEECLKSLPYESWQFKPFDGKIRVPEEIDVKQLPNVKSFQWITEIGR